MKPKVIPFLFVCLFLLCNLAEAKPKTAGKSDEAVLKAAVDGMQKFWDEMKSFRANFTQVVFAKRLGTRDPSAGKIFISKPGKLRWQNKADGSFQIMNDSKLTYVHYDKRRQHWIVDIWENGAKTINAKALQFLAGKADFKKTYKTELVKMGPKLLELKLIPLAEGSESYIAEIDKESYVIQSLTTETVDTRARIEFKDIEINQKIEAPLFDYVVKPSDVVHRES